MSTPNSQFLNQACIDNDKEQRSKARLVLKYYDLNKESFPRFRINHEQGIFGEAFVPVFFHYVLGTFNLDWALTQNTLLAVGCMAVSYFRIQTVTQNTLLSWISAIVVLALNWLGVLNLWSVTTCQLIHFVILALNMELISRFLPGCFSVSEMFAYACANAFYCYFFFDSTLNADYKRNKISGDNAVNVCIFAPWMVLNVWGLTHVLLTSLESYMPSGSFLKPIPKLVIGMATGFAITLRLAYPYDELLGVVSVLSQVVLAELGVVLYMAFLLTFGYFFISEVSLSYPLFMTRKAFHLVAFLTFAGPIVYAGYQSPQLLIFAFNCVSVFLIILELARYEGSLLPESLSKWFKSNCDGQEKLPNTLIATHIYLLMGCGLPASASYILLNGSVFTPEWVLYSLAGVVFLGIGDSFAAIGGKKYGKNRWRELSPKTQEGSSYCVITVSIAYYIFCKLVDEKASHLFLCFLFAAIPAAVVEGCTMQYDNLIGSMFFFSSVVFFHALFDF